MQVTQEHIKFFKAAYYNNTGDEADDPLEIALKALFAQFPTTPLQSVSRDEALDFLGTAARNWRRLPPLSEDDIGDVATALLWFSRKRTPPISADVRGRPDGHCSDDAAWKEFNKSYGNRARADLCKGDMTDFALANAQFMCDRSSLDLIVYQTAAKERIRWLSIQLARALDATEGSADV